LYSLNMNNVHTELILMCLNNTLSRVEFLFILTYLYFSMHIKVANQGLKLKGYTVILTQKLNTTISQSSLK